MSTIAQFFKLPTRICAAALIVTGALLFLPVVLLASMGLDALVTKYKAVVGITFLASAALLLVDLLAHSTRSVLYSGNGGGISIKYAERVFVWTNTISGHSQEINTLNAVVAPTENNVFVASTSDKPNTRQWPRWIMWVIGGVIFPLAVAYLVYWFGWNH